MVIAATAGAAAQRLAMVEPGRARSGTASLGKEVRAISDASAPSAGRSIAAGVLIGIGVAAFVDETVFHQLLHWHHFYDKSTPAVGLVSDGLFHAFGWLAVVIGLVMVADLSRRARLVARAVAGGVLVGAGGFQLYDGTIQHKLLRLHQIRYNVEIAPYDWTWNIVAVILLVIGAALLRTVLRQRAGRA